MKISDLRRSNTRYELEFDIDGISEEYKKYLQIAEIQNPTDKEIEEKLELRDYLNNCFFLPNGNLYEYLAYSINSIIDLSFNKHKYIFNFQELFVSITNCLQFFSDKNSWKTGTTKFDVFNYQIEWSFSIWISESEVEELLSIFSTKDKMLLTAFAGLDIHDLSHSTLIKEVIPKEAYQFTIDYFQHRISDDLKEKCFQIGNWQIGLG